MEQCKFVTVYVAKAIPSAIITNYLVFHLYFLSISECWSEGVPGCWLLALWTSS